MVSKRTAGLSVCQLSCQGVGSMFTFLDYFEESLENTAYAPGEELQEHFFLLDMLLEGLLEHKGFFEDKGWTPGSMSRSAFWLRAVFEEPPIIREETPLKPVAEDYFRARAYIHHRALKNRETAPFSAIAEQFELTDYEYLAVLLALGACSDEKYGKLFGLLQERTEDREPTLGLLETVYQLVAQKSPRLREELLSGQGTLQRYFFLWEEKKTPVAPPRHVLRLHPLMAARLSGIRDQGFYRGLWAGEYEDSLRVPDALGELREQLLRLSSQTLMGECYGIETADASLAEYLEAQIAAAQGIRLYLLDLSSASFTQRRFAGFLEDLQGLLIQRRLCPGRLLIKMPADEKEAGSAYFLLKKLCFLHDEEEPAGLYGFTGLWDFLVMEGVPSLKMEKPRVEERLAIWKACLGLKASAASSGGKKAGEGGPLEEDVSLEEVADCYEISFGEIKRAAAHARLEARVRGLERISREILVSSILRQNTVSFGALATQIRPVYTWEDITMADSQRAVLKTACDRYKLRNRIGEGWGLKRKNAYGNGVSILLYGPPGTGKTMAAQVMAREVGLPLYRVDLSQLFSKYIGETEKNLSMVFSEAGKSNVILFFDEADALFSKRTEVNDSNDKFANAETAYLLQKIEEYSGISILATNNYNNFDQAFVRRITYAVHLDSPDAEQRLELWQNILPPEAPLKKNIDFKFLADEFELSGSNIKAILYSAAYMAAADGEEITPRHIVKAMKYEFEKLGWMIDASRFGKYAGFLYR